MKIIESYTQGNHLPCRAKLFHLRPPAANLPNHMRDRKPSNQHPMFFLDVHAFSTPRETIATPGIATDRQVKKLHTKQRTNADATTPLTTTWREMIPNICKAFRATDAISHAKGWTNLCHGAAQRFVGAISCIGHLTSAFLPDRQYDVLLQKLQEERQRRENNSNEQWLEHSCP